MENNNEEQPFDPNLPYLAFYGSEGDVFLDEYENPCVKFRVSGPDNHDEVYTIICAFPSEDDAREVKREYDFAMEPVKKNIVG